MDMETLFKNTQAYRLIKKESEENNNSHAYLLLLNDSRNLKSCLKLFAKLFFSTEYTEDKKRIGKLIDEENFSDCLFFPTDGKKLTVEDAENIKEESLLSPIEGRKKVFVLSDFAEANVQTQNKLLKLLEEPPEGVVFLLGATSAFPVLTTVLSRTKKLEILPFPILEINSTLSRIYGEKYDRETLEICSVASGGILGEAQNMLEGEYYKTLAENAFSLVLEEDYRLPQIIKTVGETKYKKEILGLLRLIFRDALLKKTDEKLYQKSLLLGSEKSKIEETAKKYSLSALLYAQEALAKAELDVQFNAVFPQCLEICLANIRKK